MPTNVDTMLLIDLENRKIYPYFNVSTEEEYFVFGDSLLENIEQICCQSGLKMIYEDFYIQNGCYREDFWGTEKFFGLTGASNPLVEKKQSKNGKLLWNVVKR